MLETKILETKICFYDDYYITTCFTPGESKPQTHNHNVDSI